jgi:hypothetical protein
MQNVTKQNIKIKIITYLYLIMKAVKRQHASMFCCVVQKYIYMQATDEEQSFVSAQCSHKAVYKN